WLSLAGVGIEVDPVSVVTEHKHPCLWQRIAWCHPRLSHQVRSALATGAQIQNMCVPIVIGERSHWLIRRPATSLQFVFRRREFLEFAFVDLWVCQIEIGEGLDHRRCDHYAGE